MRKPDQHGVFKVPEDETHWSCGFGKCQAKADFIVLKIWHKKKGSEEKRMGACKKCAERWAAKDDCETCLRVIRAS